MKRFQIFLMVFLPVGPLMAALEPHCRSGWAYTLYHECPNPQRPVYEADKEGICPGDPRCLPAVYKNCRHESNGFDWERPKDTRLDVLKTREIGGGADQISLCQETVKKFNERSSKRGEKAEFVRVRPDLEVSRRDLGRVRYTYYCEVKRTAFEPLLARSPHCGVEYYALKVDEIRDRRSECGEDTDHILRAESIGEIEGLARSYCIDCSHLDRSRVPFMDVLNCVADRFNRFANKDNPSSFVATREDQEKLGEVACELLKTLNVPAVKKQQNVPAELELLLTRAIAEGGVRCE